MACVARVVAPGFPHHVTQRGNRPMDTFFCDEGYGVCVRLVAGWSRKCGADDALVRVAPLLCRWPDWAGLLSGEQEDECMLTAIRRHSSTGRPLGDEGFVTQVAELVGRELKPGKPGRPRNAE